MENVNIEIALHPFNESAINNLLINSPKFANGFKPDELNIYQKKQIYSQIKQMDHKKSNNVYNLFFEATVSNLN